MEVFLENASDENVCIQNIVSTHLWPLFSEPHTTVGKRYGRVPGKLSELKVSAYLATVDP